MVIPLGAESSQSQEQVKVGEESQCQDHGPAGRALVPGSLVVPCGPSRMPGSWARPPAARARGNCRSRGQEGALEKSSSPRGFLITTHCEPLQREEEVGGKCVPKKTWFPSPKKKKYIYIYICIYIENDWFPFFPLRPNLVPTRGPGSPSSHRAVSTSP